MMSAEFKPGNHQPNTYNYTYPEFVIDERSGRVAVNLIDNASGRVVRHIPSSELTQIVQGHSLPGKDHRP